MVMLHSAARTMLSVRLIQPLRLVSNMAYAYFSYLPVGRSGASPIALRGGFLSRGAQDCFWDVWPELTDILVGLAWRRLQQSFGASGLVVAKVGAELLSSTCWHDCWGQLFASVQGPSPVPYLGCCCTSGCSA